MSKPKPVDIDKIDLIRMRDRITDIPGIIEYAHSVGGFSIVPTQEGAIKGQAMKAMEEQTQEQMDQILGQMRHLAVQAKEIQDRVEISHQIYHAEMNFAPVMGGRYFLYKKNNERDVLSLIAPDEWNGEMKFKLCLAKVQLLADHTWKVLIRYSEGEEQ